MQNQRIFSGGTAYVPSPAPPNYDEQNREQSVSVRIYLELKRKILDAKYTPGALLTGGASSPWNMA